MNEAPTLIDLWRRSLDTELERIERCVVRLSIDAIWRRPRAGMNSIGNLCLHLAGNEHHYIGHGIGATDYRRDRSAEFTRDDGFSADELLAKLRAARNTTRSVLSRITAADFSRPVAIDYPPDARVLSVLQHVVEHYAYHSGQIVLLTKLWRDADERLLEWGH